MNHRKLVRWSGQERLGGNENGPVCCDGIAAGDDPSFGSGPASAGESGESCFLALDWIEAARLRVLAEVVSS